MANEWKAGRGLDATIAIHVMGWTKHEATRWGEPMVVAVKDTQDLYTRFMRSQSDKSWQSSTAKLTTVDNIPHFSTDISAAWEVAEKLTAREASELNSWIHFSIRHREYDGVLRWEAHFGLTTAAAETAPLAICLAALKALETPASR